MNDDDYIKDIKYVNLIRKLHRIEKEMLANVPFEKMIGVHKTNQTVAKV